MQMSNRAGIALHFIIFVTVGFIESFFQRYVQHSEARSSEFSQACLLTAPAAGYGMGIIDG
jgi:hypothetical protein